MCIRDRDRIAQMNEDALRALQYSQETLHKKGHSLYGEYSFFPPHQDRIAKIDAALKEINLVIRPTIGKLQSKANISEIQDTIYRKFQGYQNEVNTCIFSARNVGESNYCADKFAEKLQGEGKAFVIDLLKEYQGDSRHLWLIRMLHLGELFLL
eukprot:TRINITY_DN143_c0_g1_i4.p2 TRINITY_DN143_c0_g1~~TRINITY_DN143_c0_g1_i4.p2  ORF type:complete len:154 (-),score=46.14 TRINITY_DN143_c0_g1_i4:161-622(-)